MKVIVDTGVTFMGNRLLVEFETPDHGYHVLEIKHKLAILMDRLKPNEYVADEIQRKT